MTKFGYYWCCLMGVGRCGRVSVRGEREAGKIILLSLNRNRRPCPPTPNFENIVKTNFMILTVSSYSSLM